MSDLFGNHIVGFPTRRLILLDYQILPFCGRFVIKCKISNFYFVILTRKDIAFYTGKSLIKSYGK